MKCIKSDSKDNNKVQKIQINAVLLNFVYSFPQKY